MHRSLQVGRREGGHTQPRLCPGWFPDPTGPDGTRKIPGGEGVGLRPMHPAGEASTPRTPRADGSRSQVLSENVLFAPDGALKKVLTKMTDGGLEKLGTGQALHRAKRGGEGGPAGEGACTAKGPVPTSASALLASAPTFAQLQSRLPGAVLS